MKNTVSDYFPVEQEYGYSVFATVFHSEYNGKKLNFIDCPGSDDFVGAAMTALNVTDTAVIVLNGQHGVEVGTQNHFRYTDKLGKPVIFLLNQLDDEKCDFDMILEKLQEAYGPKVIPVQFPVQTGPGFNSIIDVLMMKQYTYGENGGKATITDIPADQLDKAQTLHRALVEAAAEHDDSLMEKFFESESLTEDEMREGIRKGLLGQQHSDSHLHPERQHQRPLVPQETQTMRQDHRDSERNRLLRCDSPWRETLQGSSLHG